MKPNPPFHEICYDPQADALYIRFNERPVSRTVPLPAREFLQCALDLDADVVVVGLEIIGLKPPPGVDGKPAFLRPPWPPSQWN